MSPSEEPPPERPEPHAPAPRLGAHAASHDWNVVVTVREGGFHAARRLLREWGAVHRSGYLNVLVMRADDPDRLLAQLAERASGEPEILTYLSRVVPVRSTFSFQSPEEFESKARAAALEFVPALAGKSFHVRMYRHGFKGRLISAAEERLLGEVLLGALDEVGAPGRVTFTDPDAILAVVTIGNRAGMSLWTREDLKRYPFLGLD
ncbi:MAG TPA: hypothetical protein VIL46_06990 [Gemmataceae bacterium]